MSTFIERHGYVKYPTRGYRAEGPCEVPGCALLQHQQLAVMNLLRIINEIDWHIDSPFPDRDKLNAAVRDHPLDGMVHNPGKYHYEIDHCHRHGWTRGNVCRSCNNVLSYSENVLGKRSYTRHSNEYIAMEYGVTLTTPDYGKYMLNCPECRIVVLATPLQRKQIYEPFWS